MRGELYNISASPHIRAKADTSDLMRWVIIALSPAALFGCIHFGEHAILLMILSVATAIASEMLMNYLMHRKQTYSDFSAIVTGLLLGMNLPPNAPWWIAILGSGFAIIIVKMLFGGLGQNFMNPALGGRCFLLISFAGIMCDFTVPENGMISTVDTVSGATPLAAVQNGETVSLLNCFLGNTRGTIGETSAFLLILGGLFLVYLRIIDWRIPVCYIGSYAVFALIFALPGHGFDLYYLAMQLCTGGLMLGAWFMATDYVTSPITPTGRVVFGLLLGLLTAVFRFFGASAEGVSYAIIFCNLLVPLIERLTIRKAFGRGGVA